MFPTRGAFRFFMSRPLLQFYRSQLPRFPVGRNRSRFVPAAQPATACSDVPFPTSSLGPCCRSRSRPGKKRERFFADRSQNCSVVRAATLGPPGLSHAPKGYSSSGSFMLW